jgi:hypothetical protein
MAENVLLRILQGIITQNYRMRHRAVRTKRNRDRSNGLLEGALFGQAGARARGP